MKRSDEGRALQVMAIAVTALVVGVCLYMGRFVLVPLVIALFLCKISQPLIEYLQARRVPRWVSVATLMLFMTASVVSGVWLLGLQVGDYFVKQVTAVAESAQESSTPAAPLDDSAMTVGLDPVSQVLMKQVTEAVLGSWQEFQSGDLEGERVVRAWKAAGPAILTFGYSLVLGLLTSVKKILLTMFFMLFIYADQHTSRRRILAAAGESRGEIATLIDSIDRDVRRYLVAKAGISFATAACIFVGLLLLGVPNPALYAFIAFVLNFVPTFGSIIAGIFPVTAELLAGSPAEAAMVAGLFLGVNVLFGNIIEPKVLGKELNLSPLVVLIAVVIWASLWGVAGMFVAAPLTRVIQLVLANIPSTRSIAILMSNGESRSV